jgi:hypothetical protein
MDGEYEKKVQVSKLMQNAYKVHKTWNLLYVPRIIKADFGSSQ